MNLSFCDIRNTPINDINILEKETYDHLINFYEVNENFISKVEGLSIKLEEYIGHIYAHRAADQADIISFVIKEKFRKQNFGTLLFKAFISNLRINGVKNVFLEVSEKNIIAQKFYYRFGFENVGYRKDYYKEKSGKINAYLFKTKI
ncbi:MAG: ribosomal-protein-alanine acetyltransferase [SAR116 cluster bacterium]|nr:ribosomal-protein-alanine acetyltransferase [SAR116 cluster bacterium]